MSDSDQIEKVLDKKHRPAFELIVAILFAAGISIATWVAAMSQVEKIASTTAESKDVKMRLQIAALDAELRKVIAEDVCSIRRTTDTHAEQILELQRRVHDLEAQR